MTCDLIETNWNSLTNIPICAVGIFLAVLILTRIECRVLTLGLPWQ